MQTLVRKTSSLNAHDNKNTKLTKTWMMILKPQLQKIAIKKRVLHLSSSRKPDIDFQKPVDTLEQAEITIKLEETKFKNTINKYRPYKYFTNK